jgi:hypothetical protein
LNHWWVDASEIWTKKQCQIIPFDDAFYDYNSGGYIVLKNSKTATVWALLGFNLHEYNLTDLTVASRECL